MAEKPTMAPEEIYVSETDGLESQPEVLFEPTVASASPTDSSVARKKKMGCRLLCSLGLFLASVVVAAGALFVLIWQDIIDQEDLRIWEKDLKTWVIPTAVCAWFLISFFVIGVYCCRPRATKTLVNSPVERDLESGLVQHEGQHAAVATSPSGTDISSEVQSLRALVEELQREKETLAEQVTTVVADLKVIQASVRRQ